MANDADRTSIPDTGGSCQLLRPLATCVTLRNGAAQNSTRRRPPTRSSSVDSGADGGDGCSGEPPGVLGDSEVRGAPDVEVDGSVDGAGSVVDGDDGAVVGSVVVGVVVGAVVGVVVGGSVVVDGSVVVVGASLVVDGSLGGGDVVGGSVVGGPDDGGELDTVPDGAVGEPDPPDDGGAWSSGAGTSGGAALGLRLVTLPRGRARAAGPSAGSAPMGLFAADEASCSGVVSVTPSAETSGAEPPTGRLDGPSSSSPLATSSSANPTSIARPPLTPATRGRTAWRVPLARRSSRSSCSLPLQRWLGRTTAIAAAVCGAIASAHPGWQNVRGSSPPADTPEPTARYFPQTAQFDATWFVCTWHPPLGFSSLGWRRRGRLLPALRAGERLLVGRS